MSKRFSERIPCGAGAVKPGGAPVSGMQERGNTRVARAAIARNSPLGASNITIRLSGPDSCCAAARRHIDVLRAVVTSRATGHAKSAIRGGRTRRAGTSRNKPPKPTNKKTVPSDPSNSAFSSRHARLEHGIRQRCDVSPFASRSRFYPTADQRSGARPLRSGRSLLFDAAFRSPAATIDLAISPRSQVDVPGLHLQSNSENLV